MITYYVVVGIPLNARLTVTVRNTLPWPPVIDSHEVGSQTPRLACLLPFLPGLPSPKQKRITVCTSNRTRPTVNTPPHTSFRPCSQPITIQPHTPLPSAPLKAANRAWFRFPSTRSVFRRSMSLSSAQFAIRATAPSRPTTMGPRWSRTTAAPSTWSVVAAVVIVVVGVVVVEEWSGAAGSAGRAAAAAAGDDGGEETTWSAGETTGAAWAAAGGEGACGCCCWWWWGSVVESAAACVLGAGDGVLAVIVVGVGGLWPVLLLLLLLMLALGVARVWVVTGSGLAGV